MDEKKKTAFNTVKYAKLFGITFYLMGIVLIIYSISIEFFDIDNGYFVWVMLIIISIGVGYLNLMGHIIKKEPKN